MKTREGTQQEKRSVNELRRRVKSFVHLERMGLAVGRGNENGGKARERRRMRSERGGGGWALCK
jgi:hypothetical protein